MFIVNLTYCILPNELTFKIKYPNYTVSMAYLICDIIFFQIYAWYIYNITVLSYSETQLISNIGDM
jgi:hypothetical protein